MVTTSAEKGVPDDFKFSDIKKDSVKAKDGTKLVKFEGKATLAGQTFWVKVFVDKSEMKKFESKQEITNFLQKTALKTCEAAVIVSASPQSAMAFERDTLFFSPDHKQVTLKGNNQKFELKDLDAHINFAQTTDLVRRCSESLFGKRAAPPVTPPVVPPVTPQAPPPRPLSNDLNSLLDNLGEEDTDAPPRPFVNSRDAAKNLDDLVEQLEDNGEIAEGPAKRADERSKSAEDVQKDLDQLLMDLESAKSPKRPSVDQTKLNELEKEYQKDMGKLLVHHNKAKAEHASNEVNKPGTKEFEISRDRLALIENTIRQLNFVYNNEQRSLAGKNPLPDDPKLYKSLDTVIESFNEKKTGLLDTLGRAYSREMTKALAKYNAANDDKSNPVDLRRNIDNVQTLHFDYENKRREISGEEPLPDNPEHYKSVETIIKSFSERNSAISAKLEREYPRIMTQALESYKAAKAAYDQDPSNPVLSVNLSKNLNNVQSLHLDYENRRRELSGQQPLPDTPEQYQQIDKIIQTFSERRSAISDTLERGYTRIMTQALEKYKAAKAANPASMENLRASLENVQSLQLDYENRKRELSGKEPLPDNPDQYQPIDTIIQSFSERKSAISAKLEREYPRIMAQALESYKAAKAAYDQDSSNPVLSVNLSKNLNNVQSLHLDYENRRRELSGQQPLPDTPDQYQPADTIIESFNEKQSSTAPQTRAAAPEQAQRLPRTAAEDEIDALLKDIESQPEQPLVANAGPAAANPGGRSAMDDLEDLMEELRDKPALQPQVVTRNAAPSQPSPIESEESDEDLDFPPPENIARTQNSVSEQMPAKYEDQMVFLLNDLQAKRKVKNKPIQKQPLNADRNIKDAEKKVIDTYIAHERETNKNYNIQPEFYGQAISYLENEFKKQLSGS